MTEALSTSDHAKRAKAIRTTLEAIRCLEIERDSITSQIKSKYDDLETHQHLNRKAVKHAVGMLKMEEQKRFDYEKTKIIIYDAHGWQFQPDLFAAEATQEHPKGIGQENADLLDGVDNRDAPPDGDFTAGEHDEQRRLAAVG
ncbi:MAG: hypothetical protein AB7I42_25910 [Bradyrhizobium sp.]|uniref:hypothetical protein n=1 Tax=Bradyrhizobium sp. TaxID=376 RepID=UPI003D0F90D6